VLSISMNKLVPLIVTALALSALNVQAGSPHFIGTPKLALTDDGDLCVSFKEAGLGNTLITYRLTVGLAEFTFQCFTKSGNEPQGDPNGQSFSNETATTSIQPRNGRIIGTLCLSPEQGDADCQGGGLVLKLVAVAYSAGTFCDITNNVCVNTAAKSEQIDPPIEF
jgi:hypothetical protein